MSSRDPKQVEERDPRFPHNHGRGRNKRSKSERRERQEKFNAQGGLCWWCREKMSMEPVRITPHGKWKDNSSYASFEHLIPRSFGGLNTRNNKVLAHAACNNKRHKRKWSHDPIYGEKEHATKNEEQSVSQSI